MEFLVGTKVKKRHAKPSDDREGVITRILGPQLRLVKWTGSNVKRQVTRVTTNSLIEVKT